MRCRLWLGLTSVLLLGIWTPATANGDGLPACAVAARPPETAPLRLPGEGAPTCRATPTATLKTDGSPRPSPGYHHLGATTASGWSGALGRLAVSDPGVRAGTYDFVATRFLAKRADASAVHWLEAGWTETGWSGGGRQRMYTFDSGRDEWRFYDQYALHAGDRVWLLVEGTAGDWRAWLWWGSAWHLLAAEHLPLGEEAQIEQYVEVYADPARPAQLAVPRVEVDNVQLRSPDGAMTLWRAGSVATEPGLAVEPYCLDWAVSFDTWSAGTC